MPTLRDGDVQIFTFKEGLLSPVAHDLRLSVGRFEVELDGDRVVGRFPLDSLRVDGVMRDGRFDPDGLDAKQKAEVLENARTKVLRTREQPEVRFEGHYRAGRLTGQLRLASREGLVDIAVGQLGGRLTGEVVLTPSRYGIPPFKALLGAIRLQDRVLVRFDLPAP